MSQTMKNITVVLLALTFAYVGYVLYQDNKSSDLNTGDNSTLIEEKLAQTQIFIERRVILGAVSIDTTIFDDAVFRSYQGVDLSIEESAVGRENPFSQVSIPKNVSRF